MLADSFSRITKLGEVGRTVHLQATSLYELLSFVAGELPQWRDRADRPKKKAETGLTADLCAHLNGAARKSKGWDMLQFRTEVPDEEHKGRTIDLAPSACASTVYVDGRRFTEFDMMLPIECKRLPTPKGKRREEREYVATQRSTTGGIQRFKLGFHGSRHNLGAMIAYLQQDTAAAWFGVIKEWIEDLSKSGNPDWSSDDLLTLVDPDQGNGVSSWRSTHKRTQLADIELRHLWLEMH